MKKIDEFQLRGSNSDSISRFIEDTKNDVASSANDGGDDDLLGFLQSSAQGAIDASQRIQRTAKNYQPSVPYPSDPLGEKLKIVARLISAEMSTRIYYLQLDGFDTHAEQPETHSILLRRWSDAVTAFTKDLDAQGHGDRVCVMTFSEFGRRVSENASEGTDHGAAGPMFLCGGGLKAGVHGKMPSLENLLDGDLKKTVDFRSVYSAVLQHWLSTDPTPILGGDYTPVDVFA